jgi:NitT/TauT family transport system permease protein
MTGKRGKRNTTRLVVGITSFVGFFVLWEIGARTGVVDEFFFSSPSAIIRAAITEFQTPRLWGDFAVSGVEFLAGYATAAVLGVVLGLLAGWYRRLNYFLDLWLNFFNATPRIALMPLVVLWVGIGIWSKILVVFLGVFFAVVMNTITGVRTVDRNHLDVASAYGASQRRIFRTIVLPGSLPYILAGLRIGVGRGLIGVVIGELYAANAGLGFMIAVAGQTLQTDRLFVGVLLVTLMGVVLVELLRAVEARVQPWRSGMQRING